MAPEVSVFPSILKEGAVCTHHFLNGLELPLEPGSLVEVPYLRTYGPCIHNRLDRWLPLEKLGSGPGNEVNSLICQSIFTSFYHWDVTHGSQDSLPREQWWLLSEC